MKKMNPQLWNQIVYNVGNIPKHKTQKTFRENKEGTS